MPSLRASQRVEGLAAMTPGAAPRRAAPGPGFAAVAARSGVGAFGAAAFGGSPSAGLASGFALAAGASPLLPSMTQ